MNGADTWISPDGTLALLDDPVAGPRAVSLTTGDPVRIDLPYPDRPTACRARCWVDTATALLVCAPEHAAAVLRHELWLAPVGQAPPTRIATAVDAGRLGGAWRVAGRVVVQLRDDETRQTTWWGTGPDGLVLLSTLPVLTSVVGVRDDSLLVWELSDPTGAQARWSLVAVDPVSGATRVLADAQP